jgi:hypothetical protein
LFDPLFQLVFVFLMKILVFIFHIDFTTKKTSFFYIEYVRVRIFCLKGGGYELQSALGHWTGQSTVPNVCIEGKHIGGCDCELFSLVVVSCLSNFHGLS